jgi:hypothetical protein
MKQFFLPVLILFLVLLGSSATQAQGPGEGGPRPPAATNAPLDGGASLLLASGAVYALKNLRARRAR